MGRRNRADSVGRFELFSAPGTFGVSFVRKVTMREGDELVAKGRAKLLFDDDQRCYLYQMLKEGPKTLLGDEMAMPSCAVLSRTEAQAAAGDFGKSATAGLSNQGRKLLESLNRESYDFIERSLVKLNTFKPQAGLPAGW